MNIKLAISTLILVSISVSTFSGCAKTVHCKTPEGSSIRVSVLEDSHDAEIIKDRWNPFTTALYDVNPTVTGDTAIAERSDSSKLHLNTPFMSERLKLHGKTNTVELGEDTYKCDENLLELVQLIDKIENEKIQDRMRMIK